MHEKTARLLTLRLCKLTREFKHGKRLPGYSHLRLCKLTREVKYGKRLPDYSHLRLCKLTREVKHGKRLPDYLHLDYASCLKRLKMESLELRRLHSDLFLTCKILFGLTSITALDFFLISKPYPQHKLFENNCRTNV